MTDSDSIRASIYDAFLELGALDPNNRVATWFFGDPTSSLTSIHDATAVQQATRFAPPNNIENNNSSRQSRPSRSLWFSPKLIRSRSISRTEEQGDPWSPPKMKIPAMFTSRLTKSAREGKSLPALPPIERKRCVTKTSRARSLFRKRNKLPSSGTEVEMSTDSLIQWQQIANIIPRHYNPSAENGTAAVSPVPSPPARHPSMTVESTDTLPGRHVQRPPFALPRSVFRSLTLNKHGTSPKPSSSRFKKRPHSLDLNSSTTAKRLAASLPASPFVLVTDTAEPSTPAGFSGTPFVFITPIDNPTPLHSATMKRFSDVTSMTAPLGIYPVSISRPIRHSIAYDTLALDVPASPPPRLRPSSSYSSFQDALAQAASAASPYELYEDHVPQIRRGIEAPFPTHPILPQPLSTIHSREQRLATIRRYQEFSEQLVEVIPYKRFAQDLSSVE
ncbi:hypothetical protein MIND_01254000 [Mycena indigotica]|uniref:Uncharacterized protein n=1 Tax=Mycena indigotica TaxID=2126181 RepID=A0A8H6S1C0_9AGAR|nr:uncharacterized protein MIND_01254000 [Mycena indigotica]KAF7291109.1 hypothetical protein MIND_01254000 [Mycena indigotica]